MKRVKAPSALALQRDPIFQRFLRGECVPPVEDLARYRAAMVRESADGDDEWAPLVIERIDRILGKPN